MNSPWDWVCYQCGQKVGLRDGEPFRWYEPDSRANEISPEFSVCEKWPHCGPAPENEKPWPEEFAKDSSS